MGEEKRPKPMALGEAVSRGIIANQTLAYFIGRTWVLFGKLGVDLKRMRFRQHLQHEVRCAPFPLFPSPLSSQIQSAGSACAPCPTPTPQNSPPPSIVNFAPTPTPTPTPTPPPP
jgi:hypothetical protein